MKMRGEHISVELCKEDIVYLKTLNWSFNKWIPTPAIIDSTGYTSKYIGQKYDPSKWTYSANGWNHDHCEICSIAMLESDDPIEQYGYVSEFEEWMCHECYGKLIQEDFKTNEFVLKNIVKLSTGQVYFLISPMVEGIDFEVTEQTYFGKSKISKYLDIPRKINMDGKQDYRTFSILLINTNEIDHFEENRLYELTNK